MVQTKRSDDANPSPEETLSKKSTWTPQEDLERSYTNWLEVSEFELNTKLLKEEVWIRECQTKNS